jgi:hypothetical protein
MDGRVDSRELKIAVGEWCVSAVAAFRAGKFGADVRRAAFRRRHPRTALPRRIVTHMLRVATFELSDPIAAIVLMESDDFAVWPCGCC